MYNYLINYEDIDNGTINDLINQVNNNPGIPLDQLTLKELVFYQGKEIRTGNGVYIFKENSQIIYVGKCSARNFIERVPAHLDIRHNGCNFNKNIMGCLVDNLH